MSGPLLVPRQAWLPVTPRGVAAFARATLGRLLLVEAIVAALAGGVISTFVGSCWFPVVREALGGMPEQAGIVNASLQWPTNVPARLAENRFLAVKVAPGSQPAPGTVADIEVTLRPDHFTLGAAGWITRVPYATRRSVSLAPEETLPWWGAWELPLLVLVGAGVALALMVAWQVMAWFYTPLARFFAFYSHRTLGWYAGWKLCVAALLPASGVALAGLVSYGWLGADPIQLGLFYLLHFIGGAAYVAVCPLFLPRDRAAEPANPFAPPEASGAGGSRRRPDSENPFAARR